jgi:hypothetical protein
MTEFPFAMIVLGAADGLALPLLQKAERIGLRAGLGDGSAEVTQKLAREPIEGLVVRLEKTATSFGMRNLLAATIEAHGLVGACVCFLLPEFAVGETGVEVKSAARLSALAPAADTGRQTSASVGLNQIGNAVSESLSRILRVSQMFFDHVQLDLNRQMLERSGGNDGGDIPLSLTFVVVLPPSSGDDPMDGTADTMQSALMGRMWGRAVTGALQSLIPDLAQRAAPFNLRVNALVLPRPDRGARGPTGAAGRRPRVLTSTVDDFAGLTLATVTGQDAVTTGQVLLLKPFV